MRTKLKRPKKFTAIWKGHGDVFNCTRKSGKIAFGRGDEEQWRSMPEPEFWLYFEPNDVIPCASQ